MNYPEDDDVVGDSGSASSFISEIISKLIVSN